jgi:hypothetical protein
MDGWIDRQTDKRTEMQKTNTLKVLSINIYHVFIDITEITQLYD